MNWKIDPKKALDEIDTQIVEAWNSVNKIEQLSYYLDSKNDYYNEEYDFTKIEFESQLQQIHICFCMLLEALGLSTSLTQYMEMYKKIEPKLTKLNMLPYIGQFHNDTLSLYYKYHSSLSALLGLEVQDRTLQDKLSQFERILINTPKIIKDRNIFPQNEAQVRQAVFDVLIHVFPDTVREIPVSQVTKTYKPDIGVKSLKAAAEYKFADSEGEVKKAVGGLYEDMYGYECEDWKVFYAVIYMTDAFFTQDQIVAEFKDTGVHENWKPLLIVGKGSRNNMS